MGEIFFTADTHFGHANALTKGWRQFSSTEEMDETIIENWNKTVGRKDVVYHIGDFKMAKWLYTSRLRGKITLIRGNHDHKKALIGESFTEVRDVLFLKELHIFMCHYPMRTWHKSHYGSFNFHGHAHGGLKEWDNQMDVGVDCWDFRPISFEEIKNRMSVKEI